jgi:hypothetical protein
MINCWMVFLEGSNPQTRLSLGGSIFPWSGVSRDCSDSALCGKFRAKIRDKGKFLILDLRILLSLFLLHY